MSGSKSEKGGGPFGIWGLALLAAVMVAGAAFWLKSGSVEEPKAPSGSAAVQGSSFDAPVRPLSPIETREPEVPVQVPLVAETRVAEKPADPPDPKGATEATPIPLPAVLPAVQKAAEEAVQAKPAEETKDPARLVDPPAQKNQTGAIPAPPSTVLPAEPKAVEKPAPVDEKPMALSFAELYFRYWPQLKGGKNPFPAKVLALDGKKVTIEGYMIPIDFEKGKVRSFVLSRAMMGCCYADSFQITEMIKVVRADGKMVPFEAMARVTGVLEVGEEKDSEGYVESVYRIKADAVGAAAPGKW